MAFAPAGRLAFGLSEPLVVGASRSFVPETGIAGGIDSSGRNSRRTMGAAVPAASDFGRTFVEGSALFAVSVGDGGTGMAWPG
jgi:hypothetical protein